MIGQTLSVLLTIFGTAFLLIKPPSQLVPKIISKKNERNMGLWISVIGIFTILQLNNFFLLFFIMTIYLLGKYKSPESFALMEEKNLSIPLVQSLLSSFIKFWPVVFIFSLLSFLFFSEYSSQEVVQELKDSSMAKQWSIIFSALIVAPIVEEFFFRKFLYKVLKFNFGILLAALISSTVFALIHFTVSSFFVLLVLGLFLCYSYEKYGCLAAPILSHSLFNLLMIISILSG
tara:strand:- start:430 stop:1125 length:696 start_codon:yes stop_codon:yes gene_type:complete